MDYPWAKFGDFVFIMQTNRHTNRQTEPHTDTNDRLTQYSRDYRRRE